MIEYSPHPKCLHEQDATPSSQYSHPKITKLWGRERGHSPLSDVHITSVLSFTPVAASNASRTLPVIQSSSSTASTTGPCVSCNVIPHVSIIWMKQSATSGGNTDGRYRTDLGTRGVLPASEFLSSLNYIMSVWVVAFYEPAPLLFANSGEAHWGLTGPHS